MLIDVNNCRTLELEAVNNGLRVTSWDSNGEIDRRDFFSGGEVVMTINLLRYMRDHGHKSVLVDIDEDDFRILD